MADPTPSAGQVSEIVKQILDKLGEAATAAQTTVEAALPHVVKAYMARQIGYMIAALTMVLVGAILLRAIRGRPLLQGPHDNPTLALFGLIGGLLLLFVGLIITVTNVGATVGVLFDPTGMFILDLIQK